MDRQMIDRQMNELMYGWIDTQKDRYIERQIDDR